MQSIRHRPGSRRRARTALEQEEASNNGKDEAIKLENDFDIMTPRCAKDVFGMTQVVSVHDISVHDLLSAGLATDSEIDCEFGQSSAALTGKMLAAAARQVRMKLSKTVTR
eukprot:TRINITY_DN40505_c0_g1_i1.p3 TRINITY_DN40505_c0_g1~~TRINITY_DN40505_c0_g1_i1.p3  ORF type:complete len:111 (-),score=18.34 TRINITY_DN40505_c0_g1_i1:353-685(-)